MATYRLLTRDAFREGVFARENGKCLLCEKPAVDAHHILERRLWPDGGYYLENGAGVCEEHHIAAEQTVVSCDELRQKAGIVSFPLPPHLYRDQEYDKWGNPVLPNGLRMKGELFHDVSVQQILKPVMHLFTDRVKYPRTYHLPWSPGGTKDDRFMEDLSAFGAEDVVITVKMDGENTTMYRDYLHARSTDYDPHPSRSTVKALHAQIAHDIPEGWRVCGENLYAKHSIQYSGLESHFLVFSVWNERNVCLDWDATKEWAELLGLKTVPTLYEGKWDEAFTRKLYQPTYEGNDMEGYVVRVRGEIHYKEFRRKVGKYVRKGHVATSHHWKRERLIVNGLR